MKPLIRDTIFVVVVLLLAGCGKNQSDSVPPRLVPELEADMRAFFALKQAQARELQARDRVEFGKTNLPFAFSEKGFPSEVWKFFDAGENGDWTKMCRIFDEKIAPRSYQFEHRGEPDVRYATTAWQPVNEARFAYQQLAISNPKHLRVFGRTISESLPNGSIYFAGTDAGRFVVEFTSLSGGKQRTFTLISQNQLFDGVYDEYLRATIGGKIQVLTSEDSSKAFDDYLAGARRRLETHQVKPGEDVQITNNQVQVQGPVPVMTINARLAQIVFEKNQTVDFFIDEMWPLEWTRPLAEPHGFILKINRSPVVEMSDEVIQKDREFWARQTKNTIGDWLGEKTSLAEICKWVERIYLSGDTNRFSGDLDFVRTVKHVNSPCDTYGACSVYSKSRANIAAIYEWRAANAISEIERERMYREADYAYRQAIALGPTQMTSVFSYCNFLLAHNRADEALTLFQTAGKFRPDDKSLREVTAQVADWIQQTNKTAIGH